MSELLKTIRALLFNSLFLLYLFGLFLPVVDVTLWISIGSFLALLCALPGISLFYKLMVLATSSFSLVLMYANQLFTKEAIYYFAGMTNILVLVAYASVFSLPVKLGAYPRKIYLHFRNKVNSVRGIYTTFSLTTLALCSFMNAGAFPTINTSLSRLFRYFPEQIKQEIQIRSLIRPFILTLFCMPIAASPAIAISETGSNPLVVLSIMALLAVLLLIGDLLWTPRKLAAMYPEVALQLKQKEMGNMASRKTKQSLLFFVLGILLLIILVLTLHSWLGYGILDTVLMTIFPFSFSWAVLLGQRKRYISMLKQKMKEEIPNLSPQIALFIAIGFMINVIKHSSVSHWLNGNLQLLIDYWGPFTLLLVSLIVFLVSCTGILPQLVTVLATQTIDLTRVNLTPEWFAISVLAGVLSASAASPFTINANLASVIIGREPYQIVKKNLVFALVIFILVTSVAVILASIF